MSNAIKVMVASTVYGFEDQLSTICATIQTMGYEVINSYLGTVKVDSNKSNLDNCLAAVDDSDFFVGIIRPFYGTGNIDEMNITFEEMKRAIRLNKPYWFLVHRDVVFTRQLKKKLYYLKDGNKVFDVKIEKSNIFDERTLEMYDYVIKDGKPIGTRTGNWAQEFNRLDEALTYIRTQFQDHSFVKGVVQNSRKNP